MSKGHDTVDSDKKLITPRYALKRKPLERTGPAFGDLKLALSKIMRLQLLPLKLYQRAVSSISEKTFFHEHLKKPLIG